MRCQIKLLKVLKMPTPMSFTSGLAIQVKLSLVCRQLVLSFLSMTQETWIADEDMVSTRAWNADPVQVPIGPVTRARAKRFKESLNGLIRKNTSRKESS